MKSRYYLPLLLSLAGCSSLPLAANPTDGTVAAGSATIQSSGSTLTVTQASQLAVINWQSFSISQGELTHFLQPSAASAALNRVTGGSTSYLNGTLSANGQVYLINQNGVVIGSSGVINTASFLASTRDIADSDFLSGNLHFTGGSAAGVQNLGTVTALGGDVYFIGQTVENKGAISAPGGTVGLAAGNDVLLTQSGNEHVFVQPVAAPGAATGLNGVSNSGTIAASTAELKAAQGNIYALAINNTGTIRAMTVQHQGGHIYLTSGSGTVSNSGTLDASATAPGGQGGTIKLKTGTAGDGLAVNTGKLIARGGTGGQGGLVEFSGSRFTWAGSADLTTPGGTTGTLLFDPTTLDIVDANGTATTPAQANTATGATSLNASDLVTALNTANVTLQATTSITVDTVVDASGNTNQNNLTLNTPLVNLAQPIYLGIGSLLGINVATVNVGVVSTAAYTAFNDGLTQPTSLIIQNGLDLLSTSKLATPALASTLNLGSDSVYGLTQALNVGFDLTLYGNGSMLKAVNGNYPAIADTYQVSGLGHDTDGLLNVTGGTLTLDELNLEFGYSSNSTQGGALTVASGATVIGSNLSFNYNGVYTDSESITATAVNGGSIYNAGTLSLTSVNIDASKAQNGGAIYNAGTLTLLSSTLSGNNATDGGAIYNDSGATLTVTAGSVSGNTADQSGGGIYNLGTLTTTDNQIENNTSATSGGGIYNTGTLTLNDPTLSGNTSSGDTYSNGVYSESSGNSFTITGDTSNSHVVTLGDAMEITNGTLTIDADIADTTHGTGSVTINGLIDSTDAVNIYGGALTFDAGVKGSTLSLVTTGTATIADGITLTATGTGNALELVAGSFVNSNTESSPFSTPSGNWLVYSSDPANDTLGNLAPDYVQFNSGTSTSLLGTGNGLIYSYNPTLTATLSGGTVTKTYDGTTAVTSLPEGGLTVSATDSESNDFQFTAPTDVSNYSYASSHVADNVNGAGTVNVTGFTSAATTTLGGKLASAVPLYGETVADTASGQIGTITARTLIGTINDQTGLTYGTDPTLTYDGANGTVTPGEGDQGLLSGDQVVLAVSGDGQSSSGHYNVVSSGATLAASSISSTTAQAGDYDLSGISSGNLAIAPAQLTVSLVGSVNKTYNGAGNNSAPLATGNYQLNGVVTGDDVVIDQAPTSGTYTTDAGGTLPTASANADPSGSVLKGASPYYVTVTLGEGNPLTLKSVGEDTDSANYVISAPSPIVSASPIGMIQQYPVNYTPIAQSYTYGQESNLNLAATPGTTFTSTTTGTPDEGVTPASLITGLTVLKSGTTTPATQNSYSRYDAASYDLGVVPNTENTLLNNYALVVTQPSSAALTVIPAVLTYVPDVPALGVNSSTYGSTPVTPTGTVTGFASGESVTGFGGGSGTPAFTTSPTLSRSSHAGNYAITGSGLTSTDYTIAQGGGSYAVNQAGLTVGLDPSLITVFQGQTVPVLNVVYSGFVNGDQQSNVLQGQTLNITTPATGSSSPGSYPILLGGLNLADYLVTYLDGTLNVVPSQTVNQTIAAGANQSLINGNTMVNTILIPAPGSGSDGSTYGMSQDNGQGYGHGSSIPQAEAQIITSSSGIAVVYGTVQFGHLNPDLAKQIQNFLDGDTQQELSQYLTIGE